MRKIIFAMAVIIFMIAPIFALADICSNNGYTVVFINGMLNTEEIAKADKKKLQDDFNSITRKNDVNFILGFNSSHLGGLGDMVKAAEQGYMGGFMDYDLKTILMQVHSELNTRKVLLVGHSQGTFYTNAAYDYLVKNGVPKESIAVYNIGTPADFVAGGGNYLNSSNDKVINQIVQELTKLGSANKPLPPNITLPTIAEDVADGIKGHRLSQVYLAQAPDRIVGDMQKELNGLSVADNSTPSFDGCFIAPPSDLSYQLEDLSFSVGDGISNVIIYTGQVAYNYQLAIENFIFNTENLAFQQVLGLFAYIYNAGTNISLDKFFGAFIGGQQVQTAGNNNQPNPADNPAQNPLANPSTNPPTNVVTANSSQNNVSGNSASDAGGGPGISQQDRQDEVDNLLEKIDVLNAEIAAVTAQQNAQAALANAQGSAGGTQTGSNNTTNADNLGSLNNTDGAGNNNANTNPDNIGSSGLSGVGGGGGGGGAAPVYSKILISEIQTAGTSDSKEEFVELYNPSGSEVDLTNWYLQKKTGSGSVESFIPKSLFSGQRILAKGYFLIARQGYFASLANISVDSGLSDDGTLILKNPSEDISDKVGWGQVSDFETAPAVSPGKGQSIGRKLVSGEEQDTNDNSTDFEIDNPTPKTQNIIYSLPPAATLTSIAITNQATKLVYVVGDTLDTTGLTVTGTYSDGSTKTETITPANVTGFDSTNPEISETLTITVDGQTVTYIISINEAAITLPSITVYTITNPIISPNGDGIKDTASIDLAFSKNVKADVNIIDSSGTKIRDLYSSSKVKNPDVKIWDGKDSSGTVVPDGVYTVSISITDSVDNSITNASKTITVDNTMPVITLNGTSETTITVGGTYTDAGATALDNIDGDITSNIVVINPVDVSTIGDYTVNYDVSDAAGNSANRVTRLVHVIAALPVLSSDATVTSSIYTVSSPAVGLGTIINIPIGTTLVTFESAFTPATGAIIDYSGVTDPVVTGNTIVVTAQDGTTKATYTITVNITKTSWSQGKIDSFTPGGSFVFNTNNFMPDVPVWCGFSMGSFRDIYPSMTNGAFLGSSDCPAAHPSYSYDMSGHTTTGEYDFYISYCGGTSCSGSYVDNPIGEYYRMYFDGSVWSSIPVDDSKLKLSSDVTITSSAIYVISSLSGNFTSGVFTGGTGVITNVPFGVPKSTLESAFTPATGATIDYSGVTDPVVTGNTIVVTAQDGTTKSTYTITTDVIAWSQGSINSFTSDGKFSLNDEFMPNQGQWCTAYMGSFRDTYPSQKNGGFNGSTDCASVYGVGGVYNVDMSGYKIPGEYNFYLSYCKGQNCGNYKSETEGEYYRMYFDGSVWSSL